MQTTYYVWFYGRTIPLLAVDDDTEMDAVIFDSLIIGGIAIIILVCQHGVAGGFQFTIFSRLCAGGNSPQLSVAVTAFRGKKKFFRRPATTGKRVCAVQISFCAFHNLIISGPRRVATFEASFCLPATFCTAVASPDYHTASWF